MGSYYLGATQKTHVKCLDHFRPPPSLCQMSNCVILQYPLNKYVLKSITPTPVSIDAHGLKIQGRGYLMFFAKIPRVDQGFQEKLPGGGPPILCFYCIFINKCFEICLKGLTPHPPPPLSASMLLS
jgi:hypothetical protein